MKNKTNLYFVVRLASSDQKTFSTQHLQIGKPGAFDQSAG